jgi:hypothetical protein
MAAKKKSTSAADFRKAEEASKKKPSIQTTATYKGQKVDWQTPKPVAGNTVKPGKTELRSGGTLGRLHNEARMAAVGGGAFSAASKAIVKKVGSVVNEAAFNAASKGLDTATGAGGKVKTVMTPMGKTLGSSSIGSPAQQSARIENLLKNAERIGVSAAKDVAGQALRGINMAGELVVNAATVASGAAGIKNKKNKKK